jgi:hypothetical protein
LARSSNWSSSLPRICGSNWEAPSRHTTSTASPGSAIVASSPGRARASVDFRYRFLNRETAPFGFTFAIEHQLDKIDETTGAAAWHYGTEIALAFDREIVPDTTVVALNLLYQPEWTRFAATGEADQESTIGAAFALMTRLQPNILFGGEARYFRKHEGIGPEQFAGEALFVGPTAYFQLSESSRLTVAWSFQAWGRAAGSNAALDLVNFERQQARVVFGFNF